MGVCSEQMVLDQGGMGTSGPCEAGEDGPYGDRCPLHTCLAN